MSSSYVRTSCTMKGCSHSESSLHSAIMCSTCWSGVAVVREGSGVVSLGSALPRVHGSTREEAQQKRLRYWTLPGNVGCCYWLGKRTKLARQNMNNHRKFNDIYNLLPVDVLVECVFEKLMPGCPTQGMVPVTVDRMGQGQGRPASNYQTIRDSGFVRFQ